MDASMIVGYLRKAKIQSGCLLIAACCERSLPWSEFGRCPHLFVIYEMPTLLSNPVEKPGKVRSGGENMHIANKVLGCLLFIFVVGSYQHWQIRGDANLAKPVSHLFQVCRVQRDWQAVVLAIRNEVRPADVHRDELGVFPTSRVQSARSEL